MKKLGNLIALGVFLSFIFLYRTEMTGYMSDLIRQQPKSPFEQTSWAGLRSRAFQAYELDEHDTALTVLHTYLDQVQEELRRHDYHQHDGLVMKRHDVLCELSTVHEKLGNKYYQLGDEENYYEHLTRYRSYLEQCTATVSQDHD